MEEKSEIRARVVTKKRFHFVALQIPNEMPLYIPRKLPKSNISTTKPSKIQTLMKNQHHPNPKTIDFEESMHLGSLLNKLLDVILAEASMAIVVHLPDKRRRLGLADSHHSDALRRPAGPLRCLLHPLHDRPERSRRRTLHRRRRHFLRRTTADRRRRGGVSVVRRGAKMGPGKESKWAAHLDVGFGGGRVLPKPI